MTPLVRLTSLEPVSAGEMQMLSPVYPPSVGDSPGLYFLALFGLLTVALLSASVLVRIGARMRMDGQPLDHPSTLLRGTAFLVLLTIFGGAAPDVIVMLLWGEVTEQTMSRLASIDKAADFFIVWPFCLAFLLPPVVRLYKRLRPRKGGLMLLMNVASDLGPLWPSHRQPAMLIVVCALVSLLVAGARLYAWH